MATLRRKVIVSRNFPDLAKRLEEACDVLRLATSLDVEYHVSTEEVGVPETYTDGKGTVRISHYWFQGVITNRAVAEGFDGAVFIFREADGKAWGNLGSGLRGSTLRDGDHFDEMWIRSDPDTRDRDGFRIARTLAHEEGHVVKHRGITNLEVHDFDRDRPGDLESFFSQVDATGWQPDRAMTTGYALLDTLKRLVGRLISLKQNMIHPIPKEYREYVSQGFLTPNGAYRSCVHNGTDWALPDDTPIYAPTDGEVTKAYFSKETGYCCHFAFGLNAMRVMHLRSLPHLGKRSAGEYIGRSGNTGKSTGPHVHIDLWKTREIDVSKILTREGVVTNLIDPFAFFADAK